ncbi:hypothetical protein [Pseudomonas sp. NBRC 111124]|uniref:hypothetical protein n=1 Tax=Pseudomonas sp. NBRC 111124 TaxID=1661039 RepID=UPI0007612CF9|nr:hypothetical protein [Pseudomonas sp. NBRC 111124]
MAIDHNGPDAAYPGPVGANPEAGSEHGSGLENAQSEPKQGVGEAWSQQRPEDWNPPPGNPGSDQDAQQERKNGTARTNENVEVPLQGDDEAPVEEDMKDVEANNSVSSEHPQPR